MRRYPDLLSISVIAALIYWLGLVAFFDLNDVDYFWHLETGRWIVENGWTLPPKDPFSITADLNGRPFRVYGWIFDGLLYEAFRFGGELAVRVFLGSLMTLGTLPLYFAVRLSMANSTRSLLVVGLGVIAAYSFFAARPTVVTYAFFNVFLYLLFKFREDGKLMPLLAIPAIFLVWGNMHPGFLAGFALLALYVFCDFLDRYLPVNGSRATKHRLGLGWAALLFAFSISALCVNPYGFSMLSDVAGKASADASSIIFEWQSPGFRSFYDRVFLVLSGIWVLMIFMSERRGSWIDLLLPACLIVMAVSSVRHIPLAVFALVIAVARMSVGVSRPWVSLKVGVSTQKHLGSILLKDRGEPAGWVKFFAFLAVGATILLMAPGVQQRQRAALEKNLPVQAAQFVIDNRLAGHVLNTYHFGGYLLHKFPRSLPLFIDGRYNPFEGQVMNDYIAMTRLKVDWKERMARYDFKVAILANPDWGLAAVLRQSADFRLVFADENVAVLLHRSLGRPDVASVDVSGEKK